MTDDIKKALKQHFLNNPKYKDYEEYIVLGHGDKLSDDDKHDKIVNLIDMCLTDKEFSEMLSRARNSNIKTILDIGEDKKELVEFILNHEFGRGVPSKEVDGVWFHRKDRMIEVNNFSIEKLKNLFHEYAGEHYSIEKSKDVHWNFNFQVNKIEDNANIILDNNPLYYDARFKVWWRWDFKDLCWVESNDVEIINFVKKTFEASGLSVSSNRTTILNALKDASQDRKPKMPKDTWVQIGNRVFDIASDEDYLPTPEYFINTKLPFSLGDNEETPYIDSLFNDWQGDNKDILYDIASLTISPKNFLEEFFFFQGGGSDGKSVYTKILQTLVGAENSKSVNLESVSDPKERFETSFLIDKYLCLLGDGNFPVLKNTKFLKEACGSTDMINAQKKGSNVNVDFESRLTIIGNFNTLPQTTDLTDGFFRRMNIAFWNNKFDGKEDVYVTLLTKHSKELNNFMLKSLRRLREIYKTRTIRGKLSVDETRRTYLYYSNPLRRFFKDEAVEDLKGVVRAPLCYNEFKVWAEKNRVNAFDFPTFKKLLGEDSYLTYQKTRVFETDDGHVYRYEDEVPDDKKLSCLDNSLVFVYRGYRLKSSIKKDDSLGTSKEDKVYGGGSL